MRVVVQRLVLWDIDKTLTDSGGIGRQLYATAFNAVVGRDLDRLPDMAGRTDHELVLATLRRNGVPDPERLLVSFFDALAEAARARTKDLRASSRCLPGAREAVEMIARSPNITQTVVTGNIRPIAEAKLHAVDLGRLIDFDIGGYGSDGSDRATLVDRAIQRAQLKHARSYPAHDAVVIGDTTHDVLGARLNGVRAIGVATGGSTADELSAAGADAVLASLEDTQTLLQLLVGG